MGSAEAIPPATPDRSRRVYVWWGVGFAFLALLGAFCWLVVAPIVQVRNAIAPLPVVNYLALCIFDEHAAAASAAIEQLGGERTAARKLDFFIRAPAWVQSKHADEGSFGITMVPLREKAVALLGRCGEPGVAVLARMIDGPDKELAGMAARAVIMGGPEAKAWAKQHTDALSREITRLRGSPP